MKTLRVPLLLMLLTTVTVALSGCAPYTTKSLYRDDVKTVHVPIWSRGRDVYRRELEMRLTHALIERIELDTPYKVTAKPRADTELTGKIDRIEQRVLSKNPETGRPRELEATFHVSFTWKDLRSGKVLTEYTDFRVADVYIPHEPLGEDFFQGSEAVINRLARRIVETMETEW